MLQQKLDSLKETYESNPEELLFDLMRFSQTGRFVFRGYSREEQLLPGIIRVKDLTAFEFELLKKFEKHGSNYFHASSAIEFISIAQHYGLPTRLLDFTFNPYIALAFSLHKAKSTYNGPKEDRMYYYIMCADLDENIITENTEFDFDLNLPSALKARSFASRSLQSINFLEDLFGKRNLVSNQMMLSFAASTVTIPIFNEKVKNKALLFVDPNHTNSRIIMQQGLFMFPYDLDKDAHLNIIKKNTKIVRIHKSLRNQLLAALDVLGYNNFRLMPDLINISDTVRRKIKDDN